MSKSADPRAALRHLPSVDELLRKPAVAALLERAPREELLLLARATLDDWRAELLEGRLPAAELPSRVEAGELESAVEAALRGAELRGLHLAVNASGVVLHTGLGRAPVHPAVADAMRAAAASYCTVELDRASGERNQRDDRLAELLVRATGAEAAIGVNNNAAAVFLAFQTFAGGREGIVSRGELVEIGGSFRVPDVMARAGVTLREVGTTNRTRIADFRAAVGEHTGLMMKVHGSNFRVVGFTEEVSPEELAVLGRELGVTTAYDLGSGLLETEGSAPLDMLGDEPLVRDAVASGVDLVTFSGDKLLGGPQAGLIVGSRTAISALRRNPIYRALRLDKVTLAGLEATFELWLAGRGDELPARRMLRASAEELEPIARRIVTAIDAMAGFRAELVPGKSQPGSGSAPDIFLDSWCARVAHERMAPGELAARLRQGDPAVFARVHEERLLLDPRTLLPGDEARLLEAFGALGAQP